jgi:hypothetical protein
MTLASSNLKNVFEDEAEIGDGGNSDVKGDNAHEHDDVALSASHLERMSVLKETDAAVLEDTDGNWLCSPWPWENFCACAGTLCQYSRHTC